MLKQLGYISGSLGVRDYLPALTHCVISNSRVHAFDGRTYCSAGVAKTSAGTHYTAPGKLFQAAMTTAGDKAKVTHNKESGTVQVEGAGFMATLPSLPVTDYPYDITGTVRFLRDAKAGRKLKDGKNILTRLARLRPFVADDASRPWANGVRVEGNVAAVTNNVIVVEAPFPWPWAMTLPVHVVDELLRLQLTPLRVDPTTVGDSTDGVALWLDDDVFLRSVTVHGAWPKSPADILNDLHAKARWAQVPEGFAEAVDHVLPFAQDERAPIIELVSNRVRVRGAETMGAVATVQGLKTPAHDMTVAFRAEPLKLMLAVATHWDLSLFPRIAFKGDDALRGAMAGVH